MLALNRQIRQYHLLLMFELVLVGSLLFSACTFSQRRMARDKASQWADTLASPANAESLFEEVGVARPDRRGCWAAYANRVYGTDDPALAVMNYYEQTLDKSPDWVKHSAVSSDDFAVYDHPDGSSVYISMEIDSDFPDQFEKYQADYRTLFYIVVTSRPPDVREECREY